jgi:uncharacterized lipoprotein
MLATLAALPTLSVGCALWRDDTPCESVEEYQRATSVNDIVVPPGLGAPAGSGRLVIPAAPASTEPLSARAACLPKPPDYFDQPLRPPPAD